MSRTAEHVSLIVSQLQVAVVQLLTQLDVVLVVTSNVSLASVDAVVLLVGVGAGGVLSVVTNGHIADLDALVASEVDHLSLQAVQHQLSHLGAGQSALGIGIDVVKQIDVGSLADGSNLPVSAEVLGVLEVAQSLHDHQAGLSSGHLLVAAVLAVADAGDHALGGTSGHIGSGPLGHVSKGIGTTIVVVVQVQQVSHDNGHLVTGDAAIGIEVPVLIASHDTYSLQDLDGFLVDVGSIDILIARSAGTHDQHTKNHGRGQEQAESTLQVSHWKFLLFYSGRIVFF